jgi:hypothetical protein
LFSRSCRRSHLLDRPRQEALLFLGARLLDTIVGCVFALVAFFLTWSGMTVIRKSGWRTAREGR